eukprot:8172908-Pyramimonas_sp.AAC.1
MHRWCIADASPMHRRCIVDVSSMRRHPPTPSTPTPSRRPLTAHPGLGTAHRTGGAKPRHHQSHLHA